MRAGLLRDPITILALGTTKDLYGQILPAAATPVLLTNASIAAISGKEVFALGAGFDGQVTHLVTIRFPPPTVTIVRSMTIAFGTRTFLIQAVKDPDERQRQLNLICLEQE